MHPLLRRQLQRLGLDPAQGPPDPAAWRALLERVSQSYVENDQGRALLEQSLDVTSREMQGLYEGLRRSRETDLALERNKLEAVLHSLGDGLCVVDTQWKIVLMNPQAEQLLGMPLAHLTGRPVYHFLSPGPEEFSRECLITDTSIPPLEQGTPFRTDDGILLRGDGQMMPVSLVVTPVSTDGVVSGAVLAFRDATAQKRGEEQRIKNAALLRRMQAGLLELATNAALYRGDLDEAFHVITRIASQSVRVARASIWLFTDAHAAIRCADLYEQATESHTSGTELPATAFPRYFTELATEGVIVANQAQTDPKTFEFATNYLIPLGTTSMLDVPIRSKGKMVGTIRLEHIGPARVWSAEEQQFATSVANTVSLALEAADRQQTEQALRTSETRLSMTVKGAHIGVWDWDLLTNTVYYSPEWKAQLGYEDHEVANTFQEWEHRIHPDDLPQAKKTISNYLNNHQTTYELEHRLRHKDGSYRWIMTRGALFDDPAVQTKRLIGIHIDLSGQKQAEVALRNAKEAAEASSMAKSQFLANMSHEIRTPMNGVLGLAALLQQTPLTPKQQRLTDTIVRSGRSLLDIINDILDFSKIEAGKLELEHTDVHLRMLIDEVLELFAAPAHQKHLELIADVADNVPAFVKGDPARLRQVLMNLIGNAIKFTAQGNVVLSLVNIVEGENRSVLRFSVKDSGIGINPEVLRKLFQPFSQADGSTTRQYGGTGLGLAIAKQLVALMGGEIWAESQAGAGATFFFTTHLAHSNLGAAGTQVPKHTLPNQRVLVVDDNPTVRCSLDRQLRAWGLTSVVAESGLLALPLLNKAEEDGCPFDTIVIDLEMPGMSGLDTIRAMRASRDGATPRVILMTPIERVDIVETQAHLIAATLTKPIRFSDLHHALSGQTVATSPSSRCPTQDERAPAPSHGSILLAEDNAINQEVTLGMLEVLGFTATAVENGRLAVDLLASKSFSVILMDCQMPEMDGFEATRTIRQREQETGMRTPIVALTAHALQGDRDLCLGAGMDDYLSKPFTIAQLQAVLDRWLPSSSQPIQADSPRTRLAPPLTLAPQTDESPVDPKSWDSIFSLQRPGQPDLLAKIIGLYLKDSQGLVDKILAAAQGKDFTALRETAHSLKSRSATLGAWQVADLCTRLETGARQQTLAWPEAERLGTQLQQTFTATCHIFEAERQRRAA